MSRCDMGNAKDLTGLRFGRLVAIEQTDKRTKAGSIIWRCVCDCGNTAYVIAGNLSRNHTLSCGCLAENVCKTTHGCSEERLYYVWRGIKERCYCPSHNRYQLYGGRGIQMCEEWRNDYSAFRNWALANGYDANAKRGECTIDRIDVNGNYEPSNCQWVDMKIQRKNQRMEFN